MNTSTETWSRSGVTRMPEADRTIAAHPSEQNWRTVAERQQQDALEHGPSVVSSTGPCGYGSLGRHLAELVQALRHQGDLHRYLTPTPRPEDVGNLRATVAVPGIVRRLQQLPPVGLSHAARIRVGNAGFDFVGARRLPAAEHLLAFNGHARRHIRRARRMGYRSVGLVSATSHMAHVARQHRKAHAAHPIEEPWGPALLKSNLVEYQAADLIHVSSQYAWESFVDEGIPEHKLRFFPLTPHPRFTHRPSPPTVPTFNIVYVGSLSVTKGVPLLIETIRRLPFSDLRLVLVGGWGTRGMRRFVESARAADARILVRPGDPLPHTFTKRASACTRATRMASHTLRQRHWPAGFW